jgi:hypothetical protein
MDDDQMIPTTDGGPMTARPIYLDVLRKADGGHVATHDITYASDEETDALITSIDFGRHLIRVRAYQRDAITARLSRPSTASCASTNPTSA